MALVIVLAGVLVANVIPDGPTGHLAYAQTADSSIEFAENGTSPVAPFFAYDQDGDAIVWSLCGPDADQFTIDGGVLAFREPPNYEDPQSASTSELLSSRNIYRVTVEAAGGTRSVTVTVTDVDEAGVASIDRPQPQVGRPLSASLSDEDDMVEDQTWQWARSEDGTTWTDIKGATSPERRPAPSDVGRYLRATVTYSDKFGAGKTASAVSANPVEAKTLADSAPSFAGRDDDESTPDIDIARSVDENTAVGMPIGEPVSALDPDEDILFYELLDTPDLEDDDGDARFTIDSLSGQIRVGRVLGADAGETEDEGPTSLTDVPGAPGNSQYVLRVRASDPSTASVTVNVIVTVTEVNEPPAFSNDAPTLLNVVEKVNEDPPVIRVEHDGLPIDADTYGVTDQDGSVDNSYNDTNYTYSVSGADSDDFSFDSGTLAFKAGHEPDFEDQSSYSITVVAHSGQGSRVLSTALDVTIEVVDGDDAGAVVLSQRQPEVGIAIQAMASDDDGGVTIKGWVWELSDVVVGVNDRGAPLPECQDPTLPVGIWTRIPGATSAVYAPKATGDRRAPVPAGHGDLRRQRGPRSRDGNGSAGSPSGATRVLWHCSGIGRRVRECPARVPRPGLHHRGRPVRQDEPGGAGEYGGRAKHWAAGQRPRRK